MPTDRLRYYAGDGFENQPHRRQNLKWLILPLLLLVAATLYYLRTDRGDSYLLVTADSFGIPILINLAGTGASTPALLIHRGGDSLNLSLKLVDAISIPSHLVLFPSCGETLRVHFGIEPTAPPSPEPLPVNAAADSTVRPVRQEPVQRYESNREPSLDLLLPPTTGSEQGIWLASNIPGIDWEIGGRISTAAGKRLFLPLKGNAAVSIVPRHPDYIFLPESLEVVPEDLFDPFLYFHARPRRELRFTLDSQPLPVQVLLGGQELGTTPLEINLDRNDQELRFLPPPGYLIPPPLPATEATAGTLTLELQPSLTHGCSCTVTHPGRTGYLLPGAELQLDGEDDRVEIDGRWFWRLGLQFLSRRPHGSRALVCDFQLPEYDRDRQLFRLHLRGRDSGDNYPLTIRNRCSFTVWINERSVLEEVGITDSELGAGAPGWEISRYLRPGDNRIVVQAGENSLRYLLLSEVRVEPENSGP